MLLRAGLVVACLVAAARAQDAEPATVRALVADALRNGSGDFQLFEYTHLQRITRRARRKDGRIEEHSTLKEAFVPQQRKRDGRVRWVYVLIEQDGVAVPPARVAKERLRAGMQLNQAELDARASESVPRGLEAPGIYFGVSIGSLFHSLTFNVKTILRTAEFQRPRIEWVGGRECLALDFRPPPEPAFSDDEDYLRRLGGIAWFDPKDRVLVRLEGWPLDGARAEPPYVAYDSLRTPEGKWLPRRIALHCDGRKAFFRQDLQDVIAEFSQYERFGIEAKDVKMIDPDPAKGRVKPE